MADIFISYARPDRDLAVQLTAFLEAQGWSVWWDHRLEPGDEFRTEILHQLQVARAVVVIWTNHSIKSKFVRSEASIADDRGCLFPTMSATVSPSDIPPPFGELHTECLDSTEGLEKLKVRISRAVLTPGREITTAWHFAKVLRYHAVTHVGVAGSAIALFVALKGALDLSPIARMIAENFHEWSVLFWQTMFGIIGIYVPGDFSPLLSFIAFSFATALAARRREYSRAEINAWLAKNMQVALGAVMAPIFFWALLNGEKASAVMLAFVCVVVGIALFAKLTRRQQEGTKLAAYNFVIVLSLYYPLFDLIPAVNLKSASALAVALIFPVYPILIIHVASPRVIIARLERMISYLLLIVSLNYLSIYAPLVHSLLLQLNVRSGQ